MKFLCVTCDQAMELASVEPVDGGSLTVTFACPACERATAMLTNPSETQMVQSLGVKIGPRASTRVASAVAAGAQAEAAAGAPGAAGEATEAAASGCPFSGMLAEMEAARTPSGPRWTDEALARLDNIPEFVRPMARQGIEHYATSNGHALIDERILDEARERFGM